MTSTGGYSYIPAAMDTTGSLSPDLKRDQILKAAVRVLKLFSRTLSLACSTVVIGLSATSFAVFISTRDLPPLTPGPVRPWANPTKLWPQILTFALACLSFITSAIVLGSYLCRGNRHRRAESISWVATAAAAAAFIGAIVVWAAAGASMQAWRDNQRGKDLWGWACDHESKHAILFGGKGEGKVDYKLVCKAQDWNFICTIIHIGAETMGGLVWAVAGWRAWGKMKMNRANKETA